MFGVAAAYLVAISAMLFAALSALALISTVKHLDPPEAPPAPPARKQVPVQKEVTV